MELGIEGIKKRDLLSNIPYYFLGDANVVIKLFLFKE